MFASKLSKFNKFFPAYSCRIQFPIALAQIQTNPAPTVEPPNPTKIICFYLQTNLVGAFSPKM